MTDQIIDSAGDGTGMVVFCRLVIYPICINIARHDYGVALWDSKPLLHVHDRIVQFL